MSIRLIALDLDGTALQNDHITLSERLVSALQTARDKNIQIVVCTGRQFHLLPPAVPGSWGTLGILCDGAELRNLRTGDIIFAEYLSSSAFVSLFNQLSPLHIPLELSAKGNLYLTQEDMEQLLTSPVGEFHKNVLRQAGKATHDLAQFALSDGVQIEKVNLPYIPDFMRKQVITVCNSLDISMFWASPNSVEITTKGVSKAQMLKRACALLKISSHEVMALGDSGNDAEMLRYAGLGVAMGNAMEEARNAADCITAANTCDGAAIAIERYALT